ncbi:nucleoside deaminase [Deinococcus radiopugnans]|uniref:tRNA(Adenine34) deaminase n=1 Tax=Deinococcus radiopugnans ATCC 19172 TaxID=585398 RepID=A0ABR6NT32_9DEIO|nr:nucleoside deaminase [Deinococcus radiopugnans]MBB6017210.1 tRNA(adenine34) deaminase [Deinococcus radiopugnans ATCC 19172]
MNGVREAGGGARGKDEGLSPGWQAALAEAWEAYLHDSYPIGACVVDADGVVLARGRNRLGEPRRVEGGFIAGHDLAHAEINALLNLAATPYPECHTWTVLTTVEPCPQCAGAIAMSGIRGMAYAAPDPWGGCTRLLTDDPYVSGKRIRVGRAPEDVQRVALRLKAHALWEEERPLGERNVLDSFAAQYPEDVAFAGQLYRSGQLLALRERGAGLEEALAVLA